MARFEGFLNTLKERPVAVALLLVLILLLWRSPVPGLFLLIGIPLVILFFVFLRKGATRENAMRTHLGTMIVIGVLWGLWIFPGAFPLMGLPAALLLELLGVELKGDGAWGFVLMVECMIPAFGVGALVVTYIMGWYMKADTISGGLFLLFYLISLVVLPVVIIGGVLLLGGVVHWLDARFLIPW